MASLHEHIDEFLAADVHNELSAEERQALHSHLVECADCRKLHQETKAMNTVLADTFHLWKPDSALEQRMLSGFRRRAGESSRWLEFVAGLINSRPMRIAATAAALLVLVGIGHWLTSPRYAFLGNEELAVSAASSAPGSFDELRERLAMNEVALDPQFREALAGQTVALPAAAPAKPSADVERVVVTGSQIPSAEEVGPNPVDTYRKDDIAKLGVRTSRELNRQLAAKAKAAASPTAQGGDGAEGKEDSNQDDSEVPHEEAAVATALPAATGSKIPETAAAVAADRKLIRNADVSLEVKSFEDSLEKITGLANEAKGYVMTSTSQKQENGKLSGQIVVKVLPENLDTFLQKLRQLGEVKNQNLGSEDVTKEYFDTDARMKNARAMEQRLIDLLKTKTNKVSELLQVEKELGRVREEIETAQGQLKLWDTQVQFATVTISLAEKDLESAASFLLRENANMSIYTPEVERVYGEIRAMASPKVQIVDGRLNRDSSGAVSATVALSIAPEESEQTVARIKSLGEVEDYNVKSERISQGGGEASETAKTKRDRFTLNVSISSQERKVPYQMANLSIQTASVDDKVKELKTLAAANGGRITNSTFTRSYDGSELAEVHFRVPAKNYATVMERVRSLGKVENASVQRQEQGGVPVDEATAKADISVRLSSSASMITPENGLFATVRRTVAQSVAAVLWSLRMIGVAIAFLGPWVLAVVLAVWGWRKIRRRKA